MRPRTVWVLWRKEALDILRDRRMLFASVLLPIVLLPVFFLGVGVVLSGNRSRAEAARPVVAVWGDVPEEVTIALVDELDARVEREVRILPDPAVRARGLLDDEAVHLVLAGSADGLRLYYSEVKPTSEVVHERASEVIEAVEDELLAERLLKEGLSRDFADPLTVTDEDLSTEAERGGDFAGRMIPMFMFIAVATGAGFVATDLTAGEKERGTMQTLLCAPVRAVEIVAAKYLTIVAVALLSSAAMVVGMAVAIGRQTAILQTTSTEEDLGRFTMTAGDYATVFAMLVPTALLIGAVLMVVAVLARTSKEGTTYASPVTFVAIFAGFSAFTDIELGAVTASVPLVNIAMVVRDLLRGEAIGAWAPVVVTSTGLYAVGAVVLASRLFESEQVLLGGERPWRDLGARRLGKAVPTGRSAVLFAVVLVALAYYGAIWGVGLPFPALMGVLQVGLLLVPAVGWVVVGGHSVRQTFSLRWPVGQGWLATLLVGVGAWSAGALALQAVAAVSTESTGAYRELLEQLGAGVTAVHPAIGFVLLAVLPAVCEEACFRGVVLSGLRSTARRWTAIAGSGLLFGAFHVLPAQAIPAAVLGAVLAYAVLATGSILPAVLGHLVTNGLAVVAFYAPELTVPPVALAAGLLVLAAGLVVARRAATPEHT